MADARPTPILLAVALLGPVLSGCVHHPPITSYPACDAARAVDADPPECRRCLDNGGWFQFTDSTLMKPGTWWCIYFVYRDEPQKCGLIANPSAQAQCRACMAQGMSWDRDLGRVCR